MSIKKDKLEIDDLNGRDNHVTLAFAPDDRTPLANRRSKKLVAHVEFGTDVPLYFIVFSNDWQHSIHDDITLAMTAYNSIVTDSGAPGRPPGPGMNLHKPGVVTLGATVSARGKAVQK